MNTQYEDQLGAAPIIPLMAKMAIPSVLAQLINLLYNIVDRIFIGHIEAIGTDALAGVGVTSSIIILVASFAQFVGGGGAPLAAIALGEGKRERAHFILGNGFCLLIFMSALCMAVVYIFMTPILMLIGASDVTLVYAQDYLSVYMLGTFFVMVTTGLNAFISTQGRPGIAMFSVIIGAVLNIVLDPLFIYTFHGGVKGAAYATVLSQAVSALWILFFLFSSRASLRLKPGYFKPDGNTLKNIFRLGISPFVMASTESLVGFALNGRLAIYNDLYVSAMTVMQSAMTIVSTPIQGFTQGIVPLISYNFGKKDSVRFRKIVKYFFIFITSVNALLTILVIIFSSFVADLFTQDEALIAIVCQMMPVFMFGMVVFGLQRACQNTFVATGQAGISLFIAILRKIILLIPLVFLISHFMGVTGVYLAEGIADFTAATICTIIFILKYKKLTGRLEEA